MKKKLWIMVCVAVPLTMIAAIIYHNRKIGRQQSVEHWLKRNQNKEKSWRR